MKHTSILGSKRGTCTIEMFVKKRTGIREDSDQTIKPVKFAGELHDERAGLQRRAFFPSSIFAGNGSRQITQPIQTGVDDRDALRQLIGHEGGQDGGWCSQKAQREGGTYANPTVGQAGQNASRRNQ